MPGNRAPNILCFSRNCKYFYLRRTAETEERSDMQVMFYVVWRWENTMLSESAYYILVPSPSCLHWKLGCFIAKIFTDSTPSPIYCALQSNIAYMSGRGEASLERGDECLHVSMRGTWASEQRRRQQLSLKYDLQTTRADPCFVRCWDNSAYFGPRAPCSGAVDRSLLIEPHSCSNG